MNKYRIIKRYYPYGVKPYYLVQTRARYIPFIWGTYNLGGWYLFESSGQRYDSEELAVTAIDNIIEQRKIEHTRQKLIKETSKVVRYF